MFVCEKVKLVCCAISDTHWVFLLSGWLICLKFSFVNILFFLKYYFLVKFYTHKMLCNAFQRVLCVLELLYISMCF